MGFDLMAFFWFFLGVVCGIAMVMLTERPDESDKND